MSFDEAVELAREIMTTEGYHINALYGPNPRQIKPTWKIYLAWQVPLKSGKLGVVHDAYVTSREQWEAIKAKWGDDDDTQH